MDIGNTSFDFNYPSRRQKSREYSENGFNDLPPWGQALLGLIFLGALVWVFVLEPAVIWVQQNWISIAVILIVATSIVIYILARNRKIRQIKEANTQAFLRQKAAERKAFEDEQTSKGLIKFVDRHGNEKWGAPNDVRKWKVEDDEMEKKESLIYQVKKEIEEFNPAKATLRHEYNYQLNLHGWLKRTFSQAVIESQKGRSRPDIVIDDIAIEIKGPATNQELKTIPDKLIRYPQHFNKVIVVLFEIQDQGFFEEWHRGIERKFPEVEVIQKS